MRILNYKCLNKMDVHALIFCYLSVMYRKIDMRKKLK